MAGELLGGATKIPLTHIPYKGTGPAVAALVGGQIDLFFATTPPLLGQIRAGKVTPIAVAGSQREKLLPDVPTFVELGYPAIQLTNWFGVFGPRNLPAPVLNKITTDVTAALKDPAVVKQLEDQGLTPRPISGDEFAKFIASEMSKYAPISDYFRSIRLDEVSLTFDEFAEIVQSPLPPSAFKHAEWWINSRTGDSSVDTSNPATDVHRKTGHHTGGLRLVIGSA
jgi:hypothetical protein